METRCEAVRRPHILAAVVPRVHIKRSTGQIRGSRLPGVHCSKLPLLGQGNSGLTTMCVCLSLQKTCHKRKLETVCGILLALTLTGPACYVCILRAQFRRRYECHCLDCACKLLCMVAKGFFVHLQISCQGWSSQTSMLTCYRSGTWP